MKKKRSKSRVFAPISRSTPHHRQEQYMVNSCSRKNVLRIVRDVATVDHILSRVSARPWLNKSAVSVPRDLPGVHRFEVCQCTVCLRTPYACPLSRSALYASLSRTRVEGWGFSIGKFDKYRDSPTVKFFISSRKCSSGVVTQDGCRQSCSRVHKKKRMTKRPQVSVMLVLSLTPTRAKHTRMLEQGGCKGCPPQSLRWQTSSRRRFGQDCVSGQSQEQSELSFVERSEYRCSLYNSIH